MDRVAVKMSVNGTAHEFDLPAETMLLGLLRDELRLTGTKYNCEQGECGACTVLCDGRAINSCLVLAASLSGADVVTIEGLALSGDLDPVQEAFVSLDALQCGYCTPGMVLATKAYLDASDGVATVAGVATALSGNYCRCTGYEAIVEAVEVLIASRK